MQKRILVELHNEPCKEILFARNMNMQMWRAPSLNLECVCCMDDTVCARYVERRWYPTSSYNKYKANDSLPPTTD